MIPIREADVLLRPFLCALPAERVPLDRATGLILRQEIRADRPYPALDRVCMDGIAIRRRAWEEGRRRFRVAGHSPAGRPPGELVSADDCIEVATGAPCPAGADFVIPYECLSLEDGWAAVRPESGLPAHANIHPRGSDCPEGALLIRSGRALTAPCIGVAASVGLSRVLATPRPHLALLGTGDELVETSERPAPWQLRRSNPPAVAALFAGLAEVSLHRCGDAPAELARAVAKALEGADILAVTGGVSMGRRDGVPAALRAAGIREVFHKVAIRPGKPIWFGAAPDGRPVFGLPGNPVAALVCARRFLAPVILSLAGRDPRAARPKGRLASEVPPAAGLTRLVPVRATATARGATILYPVSLRGSGDFAGLAHSDGFAEVAPGEGPGRAGRQALYHPWAWADGLSA